MKNYLQEFQWYSNSHRIERICNSLRINANFLAVRHHINCRFRIKPTKWRFWRNGIQKNSILRIHGLALLCELVIANAGFSRCAKHDFPGFVAMRISGLEEFLSNPNYVTSIYIWMRLRKEYKFKFESRCAYPPIFLSLVFLISKKILRNNSNSVKRKRSCVPKNSMFLNLFKNLDFFGL